MSESKPRTASMLPPHVVCTLFEGEHARGAVVLVNSLIASGFEGRLCLGYRGELLDCVTRMVERLKNEKRFRIEPELVPVETDRHFTMHKPHFLLELQDRLGDRAEKLWYFDPDIVVKETWNNFVEWADHGVALCEAAIPFPQGHYRRRQWKNFTADWEIAWKNDRDIYFNAGFIGLSKENMRLVRIWRQVIENLEEQGLGHGAESKGIKLEVEVGDKKHPFKALDQDALNLTASCYDGPICPIDKRGMGFRLGGNWMGHATGSAKPWNARYVYRSLRGKGPRLVDHLYWKHATDPFPAHQPLGTLSGRLRLTTARILHRLL